MTKNEPRNNLIKLIWRHFTSTSISILGSENLIDMFLAIGQSNKFIFHNAVKSLSYYINVIQP